jgi:hypothetical protein
MGMISRTTILRRAGRAMLSSEIRSRINRAAAAIAVATILLPITAAAGTESIRWYHPDPSDVTGFEVVYGSASGSLGTAVDVGLPTPVNGVYSYQLTVSDTVDTYVAVVAYNADGSSPPSNERRVAASVVSEPDPVPVPEPTPDPILDDDTALFPPDASALYSSNFATSANSDWRDTRADNSMQEDDSLFAVRGIGGTNALATTQTQLNIHSHLDSSDARSWSNYEVRGRMRLTHADGGLGVTTYSDYPSSDKYYRLRRKAGANEQFRLSIHPDAASLSCSRESTGVSPSLDKWYKFRIQTSGTGGTTLIQAKVWAATSSEPSQWQATCEDVRAGHLTSGTMGVWSMGSGTKAWDDLEVIPIEGSDTGSTPVPSGPPAAPVLISISPIE